MTPSYYYGAGKTVSVDEKITIAVPEDRYGLYAIDTLDPDMVMNQLLFHLPSKDHLCFYLFTLSAGGQTKIICATTYII
jgi:hypothetical protein